MRFARTIIVLVAALVFAAPAVAALQPGVFVDPGSPASKEYSFPLSVLRGTALGHATQPSASQPLFGVGISPVPRARTSSGAARGTANSRRNRRAGSSSGTSTGSNAGAGARARRHRLDVALASLARPSSVVPQIGLITLGLVLVGAAFGAGIAVARRRS